MIKRIMIYIIAAGFFAMGLVGCQSNSSNKFKQAGQNIKEGAVDLGNAVKDKAVDVGKGLKEGSKQVGEGFKSGAKTFKKSVE